VHFVVLFFVFIIENARPKKQKSGIGLFSRILSWNIWILHWRKLSVCGLRGRKGAVQYLCFRRGSSGLSKTADGGTNLK